MPTENRSSNTEQMVSVLASKLKKIHRDLDACQKVIWLRGGFDPAYCKDALDSLKDIDALLVQPGAQRLGEPQPWMWALMGSDGKPHFDDFCVSSEPAHLECNEEGVTVVAVYRHPAISDGASPEQMTTQGADGYRNGIKAAAELAADYPDLAQAIHELPLPQ